MLPPFTAAGPINLGFFVALRRCTGARWMARRISSKVWGRRKEKMSWINSASHFHNSSSSFTLSHELHLCASELMGSTNNQLPTGRCTSGSSSHFHKSCSCHMKIRLAFQDATIRVSTLLLWTQTKLWLWINWSLLCTSRVSSVCVFGLIMTA